MEAPVTSAHTAALKKKRRRKANLRSVLILVLIVAVIIIAVKLIGSAGGKGSVDELKGFFAADSYTAYEFDGNGKGALCLGDTTRYLFDYSIDDGVLFFDFEDVSIPDIKYDYKLTKNSLSLDPINSQAANLTLTKER